MMNFDFFKKVNWDKVKRYSFYVLFGLLCCLFGFNRLYKLGSIPEGFHIDEAALAYDSLCLSKYGVDRYLKSWPLYMIDEGGGSSIMYTYLLTLLFKIAGGYHFFLVKVPALLFSVLTFAFSMLIGKNLFDNKKLPVFFVGLLVAICPCFVMLSRYGMDCNLLMGASTVFLFFFIKAMESGNWKLYLVAGITGGLALYTYALSYIIMPIFLVLSFFYVLWTKRNEMKKWIIMGSAMFLLDFPLIWIQCINLFDWPEMHLGIFTLTKLPNYRSGELDGFTLEKLKTAIERIFVGDGLNYNSIPGIVNIYRITIVLFVIGLVCLLVRLAKSIKERKMKLWMFVLFWFISVFLLEISISTNVNRANAIYPSIVLISIEGLWEILNFCLQKELKLKININLLLQYLKLAVLMGVSILYISGYTKFANYYFGGSYLRDHKPLSYYDITVEDAIEFINEHPSCQYKGTYMAEKLIFFALSSQTSPYNLTFPREDSGPYGFYYFGALGDVEYGYNYIVYDAYAEYAQKLRNMGFLEENFGVYSLFYREWEEVQ